MTQTVDGASIPDSMAYRGTYVYTPSPIVSVNGLGRPVTAGPAAAVWTWGYMTQAEWDWWALTRLGGTQAYLEADLRLYNQHNVEANFSDGIVERPTYERVRNGMYLNVTIRFLNLFDDTWYLDSGEVFDSGLLLS